MHITGYRIDTLIGQGGMAQVYRAEQTALHRPVALKVLRSEYAADTAFAEHFLEEGRTTARLNDPHIVTVHDTGVDQGQYYLAMEYLPGGTLQRRIRQGLTREHALNIAERIGQGLAYAHSRNIIHCDIKPGNILFRASGEPVITDFGIARHPYQKGSNTLKLGSPRYMSPEQARDEPLDERSDLYSLGVIVYELLTGHPPYIADDPLTLAHLHLDAPIPRLPPELMSFQPIIDRLLAKQPEQRYTIAEQFLQALRAARQTDEVQHNAPTLSMPTVDAEATRTLQVTMAPTGLDNDPDATRPQARPVVAVDEPTVASPKPMFTAPSPPAQSTATVQVTPSPPKPRRSRPHWGVWAIPVTLIVVIGSGSGVYYWLQQPTATPPPERIGPTVQLLPVEETPVTATPVAPAPMQPPITVAPPTPESTAAELARLPEIAPIPALPEHDPSPPTEEPTPVVPRTPVEPPIISTDEALDPLRAAIEQGDYALSLALLDQQLADQPANRALRDLRQQLQIQNLLNHVRELREDNRLQAALTAINQGLLEFPDDVGLHSVAQEIRTALADQRKRTEADNHLQRAREFYQHGQLAAALQEVEQGLEYMPRHVELRLLRVRITVDQTDLD